MQPLLGAEHTLRWALTCPSFLPLHPQALPPWSNGTPPSRAAKTSYEASSFLESLPVASSPLDHVGHAQRLRKLRIQVGTVLCKAQQVKVLTLQA